MKNFIRLAFFVSFAAPLSAVTLRAQGDDTAFEIRVTDSGTAGGQKIDGISTGHAVVSKGRVWLNMKGTARSMLFPGASPGEEVAIIMPDTGKTLTIVRPSAKQYFRFNPMEMMDRMQKMMEGMGASVSLDPSSQEPTLENLGQGPVILGHKTVHYRLTIGMKVKMSAMGESHTIDMASTTDEYLAPDLTIADPFRGLKANDMGAIFGPGSKAYMNKVREIQEKMPKSTELRAETRLTMNAGSQTSDLKSVREITSIHKTKASSDLFEIPHDYKQVDIPMGPGAVVPPAG